MGRSFGFVCTKSYNLAFMHIIERPKVPITIKWTFYLFSSINMNVTYRYSNFSAITPVILRHLFIIRNERQRSMVLFVSLILMVTVNRWSLAWLSNRTHRFWTKCTYFTYWNRPLKRDAAPKDCHHIRTVAIWSRLFVGRTAGEQANREMLIK